MTTDSPNGIDDHRSAASEGYAIVAIQQVLARYCWALDHREFDRLELCFTDDARAEYSGVRLEPGIDHIVRHVSGLRQLVASQHIIGSISIDADGPTAIARSHAVAHLVREVDRAYEVIHRGLTYDDRLVETAQGWRISERVHRVAWMTSEPTVWPVDRW